MSRKKTSQEACNDYIAQVTDQLDLQDYIEVNAIDLQNPINSLMDWRLASKAVKKGLDKMTKEPRSYEFHFNNRGKFSQSQIGVIF